MAEKGEEWKLIFPSSRKYPPFCTTPLMHCFSSSPDFSLRGKTCSRLSFFSLRLSVALRKDREKAGKRVVEMGEVERGKWIYGSPDPILYFFLPGVPASPGEVPLGQGAHQPHDQNPGPPVHHPEAAFKGEINSKTHS